MTPEASHEEVRLHFGSDAFSDLAMAAFFGLLPVISWLERLGPKLQLGSGLVVALLLGCPTLPCVVLWLRQPRAVTITWDEAGVWARRGMRLIAYVPWERAVVRGQSGREPSSRTRRGGRFYECVQFVDPLSGESITAADRLPEDAPPVRRRVLASSVSGLLAAARARGLQPQQGPDWKLAGARARPWAGVARIGYPLVMLGLMPLQAPRAASLAIALLGAAALLVRALPPARELAAMVAEVRQRTRGGKASTVEGAPPKPGAQSMYRTTPREHSEARALAVEPIAVVLELAVRVAFVVLTVVAAFAPR